MNELHAKKIPKIMHVIKVKQNKHTKPYSNSLLTLNIYNSSTMIIIQHIHDISELLRNSISMSENYEQ